jgi:hypothetical protein
MFLLIASVFFYLAKNLPGTVDKCKLLTYCLCKATIALYQLKVQEHKKCKTITSPIKKEASLG